MIEKIYLKSPNIFKNILVSLYGLKEKYKSGGPKFNQLYQGFKKNLDKDLISLQNQQVKTLNHLLMECLKYSQYYKAIFDSIGIDEQAISKNKSINILAKIPYLEKEILRTQMDSLVSSNPERKTISMIYTSGTTGTPMNIAIDGESKQSTAAEWSRYNDWLGLPSTFKSVRYSGRIIVSPEKQKPPFWVYNFPKKQLFMSSYHLTDSHMVSYINKINNFKPQLLDGYPSAFYIIAKYMLKNKIQLDYQPIAISTTAETLLDHHRQVIEEAFACEVYNQYASSEGAPWIVQCQLGSYHLLIDTGVFEYIDKKENTDGTIMSELVVTSFRNFKTPLVRYRIGDMVNRYKEEKTCSCGSKFPLIHSVIGRMDDLLFTKEKGSVGRLDPAFKGLKGIKQSKISQIDIDTILVYVVPDDEYSDLVGEKLLKNLHDRLGSTVQITIIKTDKIELGKNAKFKSVERLFTIDGQST